MANKNDVSDENLYTNKTESSNVRVQVLDEY